MARFAPYRPLPDQPYDARLTDLNNPLRPPRGAPAKAQPDTFRNRTIANSTPITLVGNAASIRVLPANFRRVGLLIQNRDTTSALFIGFGVVADANSFSVAAGQSILLDFTCPRSEIYAFATSNLLSVFVDMTRVPE